MVTISNNTHVIWLQIENEAHALEQRPWYLSWRLAPTRLSPLRSNNLPVCQIRFGQIVYFATTLISVSLHRFCQRLNYCDSIDHFVVSANRAFSLLERAKCVGSYREALRRLDPFHRLRNENRIIYPFLLFCDVFT